MSATFVGAIGGGALWAGLLATAITSPDRGGNEFFPTPVWAIAGAACTVVTFAGVLLMFLVRGRRGQTLGAATVIAGCIGPAIVLSVRYFVFAALILALLLLRPFLQWGPTPLRRHRPTISEPAASDVHHRTTSLITPPRSPVALLCGLVTGTCLGYLLFVFVAWFAPLVLAWLWPPLFVFRKTRNFALGILAAAAGTTTLLICFYPLMAILG